MPPPCQSFPASKLPLHVQVGPDHRVRKTSSGERIDLIRDCELKSLFQYECVVTEPEKPHSPVKCWPVQRLFRSCQDKKNVKFMVETTSWEGEEQSGSTTAAAAAAGNGRRGLDPEGPISHTLHEEKKG
ncbi:hypothetical protein QBC42DRAFT_271747 [Cladorrhinum samala]|uniref:Uncharacterized protein n=1 Tax=Cladorrhinum samala TaxID=585594 RepID=A0AAV9HJL1_9PEZI|nr:hypothetical protein QBC42DRAFT_271747 [Cladorrhinum samala]